MIWHSFNLSESVGQAQSDVGKRYVVGELRQAEKGIVLRYFKDLQDWDSRATPRSI